MFLHSAIRFNGVRVKAFSIIRDRDGVARIMARVIVRLPRERLHGEAHIMARSMRGALG